MTMKGGIGLLLAIVVWGCGSSSSTNKNPGQDATVAARDAVFTDVAVPSDRPIGVPTETAPAVDTGATNRDNAASPDGAIAPGVDAALAPDTLAVADTQATPDQPAALDSSGARPDAAGFVDGAAGTRDAAPDAGGSLPDARFSLPDLRFSLPDFGIDGDCTTLAACCPSLMSALQTTCNAAVSNSVDSTCAAYLSTLKLLGYCL